jgi:hypothetical protein
MKGFQLLFSHGHVMGVYPASVHLVDVHVIGVSPMVCLS